MTKSEILAKRSALLAERAAMRHIERTFAVTFVGRAGISESVGNAWNAAHDAIAMIETQMEILDSELVFMADAAKVGV